MAGKGSKPRKVDGPKYRDNFDNIKWGKKPKANENLQKTEARKS
jgi:hypothetical protein